MAITRVQGNTRALSSGASVAATLESSPTANNILVLAVHIRSSNSGPLTTVSSITQTGVTWNYAISKSAPVFYGVTEIWVGAVGSGASASLTVNMSGTPHYGAVIDVCEYDNTSSTVDKSSSANGNSASTSTGTTDSTTSNDELWIGAIGSFASSQASPTNSFTLLDGASFTGGSLAYLEKIVSSTGTANSGTTITTNRFYGCIVTLAAATPLSHIATSKLLTGVGY